MKLFLVFTFGTLFGFFDMIYLYLSLFFLFFLLVFDLGSFWFGGIFFCDGLSFFLVYLTVAVLVFCIFSSLIEVWTSNVFYSFFFVISMIFFLLLLSFTSLSVFLFYVCFEAIFMFMFIFVLGWGYSPERLQASFYMVFYTIVVSFPFLVYLVFMENSLIGFKFLFFYTFSSYWWFFLFLVFLVKLPVYGVHLWLPKAHVEAPVSGSMVLAGVLLKLGGYGFLRLSFLCPFYLTNYSNFLLSVGLLGGLLCCFLCLRQADLNAFVAYSSVCHMGFGLAGLYCFSEYGVKGAVYTIIAHGFCSSCLFYILYVVYERFHSRSLLIINGMGVLLPLIILVWFIFSILNMGVPPSFSFFSEVSILSGLSGLSFFTVFFSFFFLLFAGCYGIYLYVVSCHGVNLLSEVCYNISLREFLVIYGHFFPLMFLPFFVNFFFV